MVGHHNSKKGYVHMENKTPQTGTVETPNQPVVTPAAATPTTPEAAK